MQIKNGKYTLTKKLIKVKYYISNIFEVKPNVIVLFLIETFKKDFTYKGSQ